MERPPKKTQAERDAEREAAVLKHNQKLAEARLTAAGRGKSAADFPAEIERPDPRSNKVFMAVGFIIIASLIALLLQSLWSVVRPKEKDKTAVPQTTNAPAEPDTEDTAK
jgi:hypothetical protein